LQKNLYRFQVETPTVASSVRQVDYRTRCIVHYSDAANVRERHRWESRNEIRDRSTMKSIIVTDLPLRQRQRHTGPTAITAIAD